MGKKQGEMRRKESREKESRGQERGTQERREEERGKGRERERREGVCKGAGINFTCLSYQRLPLNTCKILCQSLNVPKGPAQSFVTSAKIP